MVLFTGLGRNEDSYKKFRSLAPKNWKIYIFNSSFLTDVRSPEATAKNINKQLAGMGSGKINIAGHSLGGTLAVFYSYYYPQRVKKLFLFSPVIIHEDRTKLYFVKNFIATHGTYSWKPIEEDLKAIPRIVRRPIQFFRLFKYVRALDFQKNMEKINIPAIMFWAEKDRLVPLEHGYRLAKLIRNSRLIIFKKVGHDWPLYRPELFWENING
ncbi:MAG: alpha/beta fold hydrolase [Candidatus Levyibacteriota bacterium]